MTRLRVDTEAGVATVVVDNPSRRNAMDLAMYREFPAVIRAALDIPELRVLVVRGEDDAFISGSDVSEFAEHRVGVQAVEYDSDEQGAWRALAEVPVPVVAAIDGPCMGAGVAIASCADIRYASYRSTFSVPPARLGLAYPLDAVRRLTAIVGPAATKELLLTGRRFDSTEALRIGFVTAVFADDEFDERVGENLQAMAALAPLSQRAAIVTIDHLADAPGACSRPEVEAAIRACDESHDFAEGVAAFSEKRTPDFEGR